MIGSVIGSVMEFLKKHYEKIVLCVVLLGLAGAALWMSSVIKHVREELQPVDIPPPPKKVTLAPVDMTPDERALEQITNPPPVVLSGDHNLFNPVTWKRKANGELMKIVKTGPDALGVTNIVPLYTIIAYERPTDSPVYVMSWQQHADIRLPNRRGTLEHSHKDEKIKSVPYIVRGIKGAENDPSEINLEIVDTGETNVWVSTNAPYKRVDSYMADLKYDPDPLLSLKQQKVGDHFRLDNDPYKIVEITNNAVRVQSERTTKVTEIKWTQSRNGD
jgi:hypothetical protein